MNRTVYFTDSKAETVIDCQALFVYEQPGADGIKDLEVRLSLWEARQLARALATFIQHEECCEGGAMNHEQELRDLRCPDCGQPVDLMTQCSEPVTDPKTGRTTMYRKTYRFCPSAFHFDHFELEAGDL